MFSVNSMSFVRDVNQKRAPKLQRVDRKRPCSIVFHRLDALSRGELFNRFFNTRNLVVEIFLDNFKILVTFATMFSATNLKTVKNLHR